MHLKCENNTTKLDRGKNQELKVSCAQIVCPARLELTLPFLVANNPNKPDCGKCASWKTVGKKTRVVISKSTCRFWD
jgi:hypothetical protein